jgi:hypothetical protein
MEQRPEPRLRVSHNNRRNSSTVAIIAVVALLLILLLLALTLGGVLGGEPEPAPPLDATPTPVPPEQPETQPGLWSPGWALFAPQLA